MTREEAKKLLPIIEALSEEKTLQIYEGGKWVDLVFDITIDIPESYRIKPEPKYRPFKNMDECWNEMHKHSDFGWIIYDKKYYSVCDVTSNEITILYECDPCCLDFKSCMEELTFTDGTPFGIKEE